MSDTSAPDSVARPRVTAVLVVTCVASLVVNANTSAVSILLPAISEDVGSSVETLQWAVTGYSLVGAAVIVTSGALGDVLGRRRVFLAGLVLFVASCVLIALVDSGAGVIAGRAIQGAAGSTLLACGMSLISVAYTGKEQMWAVSLWGAAAAVGAALGPLAGGVLVETTGWQGLFWLDAGIAAACIPATLAKVEESRDPGRSRSIDYLGTLLVAVVLVPLIFALSEGGDWGWLSAATLGCLAGSAVGLVLFVAVERRAVAPLVDLRLLRNMILVGATIAILIGAGTINAILYLLSLYLQDPATLGFSPLEAGLATLPATVGLVLVAPLVPRLAMRFGTRQVIAAGFAITAVGFGGIAFVEGSWRYVAFVLPLLAIAVGMGLSNGPASSAATASVPETDVGAASGISNMARYVGAAAAVAIAASIYSSSAESSREAGTLVDEALATGLSHASIAMAILSVLGVVVALLIARQRPTTATLADSAAAAAAHTFTISTRSTSES